MKTTRAWDVISDKTPSTQKELLSILLENRGITTQKEEEKFLHPNLLDVSAKSVGIDEKQLQKTLKRIQEALDKKEQIIIFGDYDVDGITATAILWETLFSLSSTVAPYIPHRIDEGYGLSIKGVENVLEEFPQTKVIITVDNGIVAHEAVAFAKEKGIEVIITDHHAKAETLPDAFSIVHTTALCGAGIAWILSEEIIKGKTFEKNPDFLSEGYNHLSLVALATVADLVPLKDANRIVLTYGLTFLQKTKREGLLALFEEAKVISSAIDTYAIGHMIAPRLNAMGRMASAMDSLRLLCTKNRKKAKELAQMLGETNRERQLLTKSTVEHARKEVYALSEKKKILFIHHESYEEGIIGLVAGKLVEEFYLPSIVLSQGELTSKASARSISGFNIIEAIRKTSDLLINAGGHPMAAGFTVETKRLSELQALLETIAEELVTEEMLTRTLRVDCTFPLEKINPSVYKDITQLSPFGMGNPQPVFVSKAIVKEIKTVGKEASHLKLLLSPSKNVPFTFGAIGFGMGEYSSFLKLEKEIDVVYSIDENVWNGKTSIQLKIKDIKY